MANDRKITRADVVTIPSPRLKRGEALAREFATALHGRPEYDFVIPKGRWSAQEMQRVVAGAYGPKPSRRMSGFNSPTLERLKAMRPTHPAQIYSYGGQDYASFEDAKRAHPEMPVVSNPASGEEARKEYEMARDRMWARSVPGPLDLPTQAYIRGATPDRMEASEQLDGLLSSLAGGGRRYYTMRDHISAKATPNR